MTEETKRKISELGEAEEAQRRMWMSAKREDEECADTDERNEQFYVQMAEIWRKDAVLSELLEENQTRLRRIREERNRMLEESDRKLRGVLRQKQEEREALIRRLRDEQGEA